MPRAAPSRAEPRDPLVAAYRKNYGFVRRCAYRIGAPPARLDDVVRDVFLALYRRRKELAVGKDSRALLFGITRRVARGYRKRPVSQLRLVFGGSGNAGMRRWEAAETVRTFLSGLDANRRDVFLLAEVEGMCAPQISKALGTVNVNTVVARLHSARIEFKRAVALHIAGERTLHHGA